MKKIILAIAIVALLGSCKKDEDVRPVVVVTPQVINTYTLTKSSLGFDVVQVNGYDVTLPVEVQTGDSLYMIEYPLFAGDTAYLNVFLDTTSVFEEGCRCPVYLEYTIQ